MNIPVKDPVALLPSVTAFVQRITGAFVDGQYRAAAGNPIEVFDPATEAVIARVPECSNADVDAAVLSAHKAFEDGRWRNLRPTEREYALFKFAELLAQNAEELSQIETWNQGKSINVTRAVDVGASVEFVRYIAGLATKITGLTLDVSISAPPAGARYNAYTRREPVGVVGAIAPWNAPLMIAVWKIAPALAAGCSIVLKPSEITPLSAFRLAELALEAGVPPGVFNVVNGRGHITGEALVSHPKVAKISFTGSTEAGKHIGKTAMDRVARISLELGGKNAAIVLKDADMSKAIPGLLGGAFLNSGQICAAISRVYVEREAYASLKEGLAAAVRDMTFGPGMDPATQVTPLTSAAHRDRVQEHISRLDGTGAEVVRGAQAPAAGFFVSPALVLNAKAQSALQRTEVFGPVLALTPVDSVDDAVGLANNTNYGLSASLWTENLSVAMDAIPRIQAGIIWVNNHLPLDPNMPFGGFKQSGIGRDFGPDSLEAYTETKSVCITY